MLEPRKHIESIIPYPIDKDENWDLKLDFNENLIGPSKKVLKAIRNFKPEKIKFYPCYENLIKTIADFNNVSEENVVPTNGADEGYRYIFDAYCNFGDNVLALDPAFTMPKMYGSMANCNYIEVPYTKRWEFPEEDFLEKINSSIKIIILTSPNSPTGDLIPDEALEKVIQKAQNSLVVIDETYATYANKTYMHLINQYDNVLILKSMSKDFAIAGLRLGYIVASQTVIENIRRIISPYSVNAVAALAGQVAISDLQHVENVKKEIEKSKQYLLKELKPFAQEVFESKTNFICVDLGKKAQYLYKKLIKHNIKVKLLHGIAENCFRITIPPLKDAQKIVKVLRNKRGLIVFDMDGVLVDASKSYRVAIQQTFKFFAKHDVSLIEIQELKNQGGYNNDWVLTHKLLENANVKIKYEQVVKKFNEFYFGENFDGLIQNEQWLISKKELEKLSEKYDLAIFTGRETKEAMFALKKQGVEDLFDFIITSDLLEEQEQKPSPKGLLIIKETLNPQRCYYLGDTPDDMSSGTNANYKTIGILPPQDKSEKLKNILYNSGACCVLNNVKDLFTYLEKRK